MEDQKQSPNQDNVENITNSSTPPGADAGPSGVNKAPLEQAAPPADAASAPLPTPPLNLNQSTNSTPPVPAGSQEASSPATPPPPSPTPPPAAPVPSPSGDTGGAGSDQFLDQLLQSGTPSVTDGDASQAPPPSAPSQSGQTETSSPMPPPPSAPATPPPAPPEPSLAETPSPAPSVSPAMPPSLTPTSETEPNPTESSATLPPPPPSDAPPSSGSPNLPGPAPTFPSANEGFKVPPPGSETGQAGPTMAQAGGHKSRTGLWLFIFLLLAAGAAAAYFLLLNKPSEIANTSEIEQPAVTTGLPVGPANTADQTNDEIRQSDLTNLQNALEKYYAASKKYPVSATAVDTQEKNNNPLTVLVTQYISVLPADPVVDDGHYYSYKSADGTTYELTAVFDAQPEGISNVQSTEKGFLVTLTPGERFAVSSTTSTDTDTTGTTGTATDDLDLTTTQ